MNKMSKGEGRGTAKVHVLLVWAIRWLVVSFPETRVGMGLLIKIGILVLNTFYLCVPESSKWYTVGRHIDVIDLD